MAVHSRADALMRAVFVPLLALCFFVVAAVVQAQPSPKAGKAPSRTRAGKGGARGKAKATATRPSDTDPRIQKYNEPHMSWLPAGRPRNQLLVFLPGTHGTPKARFPLAQTAASLGYHVIFLMYPDDISAQSRCGRSTDPDAHLKFRLAIIRGGMIGPDEPIAEADSIESRLTQLIGHLQTKQPGKGWGRYFTKQKQLAWSRIAVAGQSQGGGHAYILGKFHNVARVLMFGSPKDYSFQFQRPASKFDGSTQTPLKRFFAFNHIRDNGNGCNHAQQMQILDQIGLTKLGVANVDRAKAGFNGARVLTTNADMKNDNFHGAAIGGSLPTSERVWRYMLTAP